MNLLDEFRSPAAQRTLDHTAKMLHKLTRRQVSATRLDRARRAVDRAEQA